MKSNAWIDSEVYDLLSLYRSMWIYATEGVKYNKAAMIREAKTRALDAKKPGDPPCIFSRSKGSVEMKLMNITAALEAIGRQDLSMAEYGYRPMKNMQKSLKVIVEKWASGYKQAKAA